MALMKYITSVQEANYTKHIVELNDRNIEVIEKKDCRVAGHYGEVYFNYNGFDVFNDLRMECSTNRSFHLTSAIAAIEIVRFVQEHLKNHSS